MAYTSSDAINRCASLGAQFIDHFNNIMDADGKNDPDFNHHTKEMNNWFNDVQNIRLKPKSLKLNTEQLIDWFFTAGSSIDVLVKEEYQEIYSDFIAKLLTNKNKYVSDILIETIEENEK